jgi:hypothetical protein
VLKQRCEEEKRPFDQIERTNLQNVNLDSETTGQVVDRFGELARVGVQHVIFNMVGVADLSNLEKLGAEVLPRVHAMAAEAI